MSCVVPLVTLSRLPGIPRVPDEGRRYCGRHEARHWMRLAFKHPSNPAFMDIAAYLRLGQGDHLAGKVVTTPRTKAETRMPESGPTSPKPAPKPIGPEPTAPHATVRG